MGIGDKMKHKKDEAVGKATEKRGRAINDPDRTAEGQARQRKANLKQAGERIKAAFKK